MTRWLRRAAIPAILATGALIVSAPTAAAHHPERVPLPTVYTLGEGHSLPCAGQITGSVETPHDQPGTAVVTLAWTPFFTSPCSITANVSIQNYDTKWHGTVPLHLTNEASGFGAPAGRWTDRFSVPIGPGAGGLTVTTKTLNSFYFDPHRLTTRFVVP